MTDSAAALASLSPAQVEGIAQLWRRNRRELVTSFSGTSMLPAIAPGQRVTVQCGVDAAVGDVAVFHLGNQVAVHRVVARGDTWSLTWGDANPLPDEPIAPLRIIGSIRDAPAGPRSFLRALLLRLVASPRTSHERLTRRIRLIHGMRTAWTQGPVFFAGKALRVVLRGK